MEHKKPEPKTVWMVSGNKGGVGKSLFCLALASALEMRKMRFAILDGDKRTSDVHSTFLRKCPAMEADFRNLNPGYSQDPFDERYEKKVTQLLNASPHLIINTPDGADNILMKWFDVTLRHTETNNCKFKFMYLMSDRPDGLNMLPDLIKRFSYLYPIRNLHFGHEDLFVAFNRDYAHNFKKVIDLPVLRGEELRMLFDLKTYPAEAIKLQGEQGMYALPTLSRSRLMGWQLQVIEAIDDIIENNHKPSDEPNVRALS